MGKEEHFWAQCECGGYRAYTYHNGRKRVPIGGCGACDKIRALNQLLDGGVKIRTDYDVTGDPDNLRRRLESAEEELERLRGRAIKAENRYETLHYCVLDAVRSLKDLDYCLLEETVFTVRFHLEEALTSTKTSLPSRIPKRPKIIPLKFKMLNPDAILPQQQTPGSAGFDLHAVESAIVYKNHPTLVKTGLAVELPPGYELQIRPRSGLALKKGLTVLNSPGTIDADYRGEVGVILSNLGNYDSSYKVRKGDRIAQGVVCPVPHVEILEVNELSSTERGSGGFGSTGS